MYLTKCFCSCLVKLCLLRHLESSLEEFCWELRVRRWSSPPPTRALLRGSHNGSPSSNLPLRPACAALMSSGEPGGCMVIISRCVRSARTPEEAWHCTFTSERIKVFHRGCQHKVSSCFAATGWVSCASPFCWLPPWCSAKARSQVSPAARVQIWRKDAITVYEVLCSDLLFLQNCCVFRNV